MKRTILFAVVLLLLAVVIGGMAYFHFVMKPEVIRQAIAAAPRPPAAVSAEAAQTDRWTPLLTAIGTFRATAGIEVASEVDGVVRAIHFESGEDVEAGALLVEIDDAIERADLEAGVAQLKNGELALERQRQLMAGGNTPKSSFDAALANRDTAAAVVERTRAAIAKKKIRAPFAGRLGLRAVDPGQYVGKGAALVSLQRLDPIYVDFPMPEQDLDVLSVGQATDVAVDAYADTAFRGRIASIDARVDPNTRTVLVRAEIANPEGRLLPGMFANVTVFAGAPETVVTVPRTAVTYSLYGDSVYVVATPPDTAAGDETRTVERRFVRVGETRDGRVAVAEGVTAGEMVVTSGQIKLQPNARVVVDNTRSLEAPAARPKE